MFFLVWIAVTASVTRQGHDAKCKAWDCQALWQLVFLRAAICASWFRRCVIFALEMFFYWHPTCWTNSAWTLQGVSGESVWRLAQFTVMWQCEVRNIKESRNHPPTRHSLLPYGTKQAVVYFRNHCWAWWKIQDNSLALRGPQLPKCTQPIHHLQWPPPLENLRWHHSSQPVSQRSTYAVILTFAMQYFIIFYPSICI